MGKKRIGKKRRLSSRLNEQPVDENDDMVRPKSSKIPIQQTQEDDDDFVEILDYNENGNAKELVEIDESEPSPSTHVEKTTEIHTKIEGLLSSRNFIVVQGPFGCGKTHTARIISKRRRIPLHILQINDQYDSKVLYGSYNCTEVPGEFVWQPSKFAQCLQQQCLILLENIDHGGSELASSLIGLMENGQIELQNGQRVVMHHECRIIGTISLDGFTQHSATQIPLQLREYPYAITMPDLKSDDFRSIMTNSMPRLNAISDKLIDTFFAVTKLIHDHKSSIDRALNSKDLFQAAVRLQTLKDFDGKAVFVELLDIWAMHLSGNELRRKVAATLAEALSLSENEQNYFMNVRQPEIKIATNKITLGRATLEKRTQELSQSPANFVLTRDSSQLLERLACCIQQNPPEPILLTGETGVGKTSAVQHLAKLMKIPLHVVNLSQESEYADLIGGYKPTSATHILQPLADDYMNLFKNSFDLEKNAKFLENLNKCFNTQRFGDFLDLLKKSSLRAHQKFPGQSEWMELFQRARRLCRCFGKGKQWQRRLLFSYVKGVVAEAAEQGHWLLVDEINLASAECLEALVELLEPAELIHPQFRLFACMNHANDVGKRSLPSGIRSKFTEFFVWETTDPEQLRILIQGHLPALNKELVESTLNFHTDIYAQFPGKFSLRTLSRALSIAADQPFSCQRSCLLHGCKLSFSSHLGLEQRQRMHKLLEKHFQFGNKIQSTTLNPKNIDGSKFVLIENSPIMRGKELIVEDDDSYIFTPSVRANMAFLASIVSTGRFPVLMEGETSAGKTSMIIQLAKMSGNRCYRINNHEHTDIQECIGTYAPDSNGRLQFVEGILLRAVKNGDWIIFDELNLAPSSVLEALNRLLDDNRELFVPELNVAVKAHPHFQLFATQNPVGTYAGRKRLSRAFLNRFMLIQCDTIPLDELPQIVHRRCGIAPTQSQLMVKVLEELKSQRAISGIFAFSDGLMTLRDLFRWGNRVAALDQMTDWRQAMVDQGYFVLAARCRTSQDEKTIIEVLEKLFSRRVDINKLFSPESPYLPPIQVPENIVPTLQLRRMLILTSEAWKSKEPVLLVGDTGCGKTTAVHLFGHPLLSINCHEHTDAADLLGSIRPITGGGFRWQDGIVLQAMRHGSRLLIDEISLAPDSVLERLNSLLEPQRKILLTDAGASFDNFEQVITANSEFQLVATMNPGNDHGKKELSKALRNRFTEIWCPSENNKEDLLEIVRRRLFTNKNNEKLTQDMANKIPQLLIAFREFFIRQFNEILKFTPSTRDLVGLVELFMQFYSTNSNISLVDALYHSIESNLLDALGILPSRMAFDRQEVVLLCQKQYKTLVENFKLTSDDFVPNITKNIELTENGLTFGPFTIQSTADVLPKLPDGFSLDAPTTCKNALRVARALYSSKPVMLEGSPGAGKSSLIMAIAAATGHKLCRLNLSEQTDLYDLFGSDVPVVGPDGQSTTFAWQDGPVLKAIKEGSWILLDEMNLASQSVLEGLNSCFDFRKNIYISELDKTFDVNMDQCRFFACQNPHTQGGNRRGLPKSFLNRFISIFIEEMTDDDFIYILCAFCKAHPTGCLQFTDELISKMVLVNKMCRERIQNSSWGLQNGGPFEFNLRDLFRWVDAITRFNGNVDFGFDLIYLSRLKSKEAREKIIAEIYNPIFADHLWTPSLHLIRLQDNPEVQSLLSIGNVDFQIPKKNYTKTSQTANQIMESANFLMATQMDLLEKLAACITANWLVLLVGPAHVGKRSTINILAELSGQRIERMRLTSGTDALDLLGSFEQIALENTLTDEQIEFDKDEPAKSNVRFEWVDSVFLRAYRDGHWLLIEDVNCCNSAVLDCLNSCLESSESELVLPMDHNKNIQRHPNFRMFFTMNPRNGQLSRAMRNRAVEIKFCCMDQNYTHQSIWSRNIYDTISAIFGSRPLTSSSAHNSPPTIQLLQKLQSALDEHSTQSLLNCMALMQSEMKWEGPIIKEEDFQQALNVLLMLLNEQKDNRAIVEEIPLLNFSTVPSEFPPLTRLLVPLPQTITNYSSKLIAYYRHCFNEISNNTQDEMFSIVSLQLAERMEEFVSQNDPGNVHLDELLEDTFPELRTATVRWKQLSDKASNETSEGLTYVKALKSHSSCKPFQNRQQIKQFAQRLREEDEQMLTRNEFSSEAKKTAFGPLQHHLTKIFKLIALVFDDQTSSNLLPWTCMADGKLFTFLRVMSIPIQKIWLEEDGFEQAFGGTLFSHLHWPYLTLATNQLLWAPLHYNNNILRKVHVGQMKNAREELGSTLELYWNLAFARKRVYKMSNKQWSFCKAKIPPNEIDEQRWTAFILRILDMIELLTPPERFYDQPYFVSRQRTFYELRQEKLNIYFTVIQMFLELTVANHYELEQISTALSRMPRCSSFLQSLESAWHTATAAIDELNKEHDDYHQSWTDDKEGHIYRGIWRHGEESAYEQNYWNCVIEPLRSCTAHLKQFFKGSASTFLKNNLDGHQNNAEHFCSQLENCIQTLESLKTQICCSKALGLLSPVAIYPDIIAPYIFLLNSLQIALSELHWEGQKVLQRCMPGHFSETSLHSLRQIISSTSVVPTIHNNFLNWTLQQQNFPSPHKRDICLWAFSVNDAVQKKSCLDWIFHEWEHWYEENARQKKEQLIVMKASKVSRINDNEEEEKEEEEEMTGEEDRDFDELRIRAYLPDFSESKFGDDEQTIAGEEPEHLNGDDLYTTLYSIFSALTNQQNSTSPKFPYLSFMHIFDQLKLHTSFNPDEDDNLNFHQLCELAEMRKSLQFNQEELRKMSPTTTLNVYKESDSAALIQCLDTLGPLLDRTSQLHSEFSENAQLLQLKQAIETFVNKAPAAAPLMKHAAQLERILVHAEEWESISDRAHSMRQQMVPLQELLVDWRRREVQYWSELVKYVHQDSTQLAVLVSWPLFKCAMENNDGSTERNLLIMSLDWIQNSTLGDFETRLWTCRLLANCLDFIQPKSANHSISGRIRSIVAHFDQFTPLVRNKYAEQFKPIESELRNFTRVVRYTDLNLWSVRDSAKKAHTQLFRILRKFKEMCNEPLATLLLDKLPKMPESALTTFEKLPPLDDLGPSSLAQKLSSFGPRFECSTLELLDFDGMDSVKGAAIDLLQMIQTDLKYENPKSGNLDGNNIDEVNEKMQGRALFERQQRFAQLVRKAAQFGLIARRAQKLDAEMLTMQTLSEIPSLDNLTGSEKMAQLTRHIVASRNVFLRQFAALRGQQHPQLSVSILENLRGINEFGLHWLYSAIQGLAQKTANQERTLRLLSKCFETELENAAHSYGEEHHYSPISHQQMGHKFESNRLECQQIELLVQRMRQIICCCPKQSTTTTELALGFGHLQEPLGPLRQGNADHAELVAELDGLNALVQRMVILHKETGQHILHLPLADDDREATVWNRRHWHSYESAFNELVAMLKASVDDYTKIRHFFPTESDQICTLIDQQPGEKAAAPMDDHHWSPPDFDALQNSLLLRLQSIYKEIEQLLVNGTDAIKAVDGVKQLIQFIDRSGLVQANKQLGSLFLSLISPSSTHSVPIDLLENCATLAKGVSLLFGRLLHYLGEFICQLASFQAHWVAIGCHLLAKGFVNAIPKPELAKGEEKTAKDGCGFGEGDLTADAQDVSSQVETMEQIEGLKNDNETTDEQQQQEDQGGQKEKLPDVDQPIDVDDDFAANLEGLDADEQEEEGNERNDEEEPVEDHADWNFGNVEEPEETQLDPKLWEPEAKDEQGKETEERDGKEGAQELTGELGAAQDDAEKMDDSRQKEGADETGQEEGSPRQEPMEDTDEQMVDGNVEEGEKGKDNVDEEQQQGDEEENGMEQAIDEKGGIEEEEEDMEGVDEENKEPEGGDDEEEQKKQHEADGMHASESPDADEEEPLADGEGQDSMDDSKKQRQQPDAVGVQNGDPNGGQTTDKEEDKDSDENEKEGSEMTAENGRGKNRNDRSAKRLQKGEEEQNDVDELPKEGEMEKQKGPSADESSQDVQENDAELEEMDGLQSSDQQKLSARATSTLEQARRTRALFDANLRRLRESAKELAEAGETNENEVQKRGENEEEGPMDLEAKTGAEEGGGGSDVVEQNIFVQFADPKQAHDSDALHINDGGAIDKLVIDRLCSEFDRLDQEQPATCPESTRELQLKWALIVDSIAPLAAELTESLRTILEPTVANRLQGDYRTGKRLNMRKLIAYIASDYRKDRIWMRRTKRAKRNYQICIAVDNSQSMQHNHMTEITCNALCLIERALRQLEVGQLAICSFGSEVRLLNDFSSGEDPTLGIRILRELKFDQQRTDLAQMLCSTSTLFKLGREASSQPVEQMLIILGDGRGVLTEGVERIRRSLDSLNSDRVTVLFLVLDTAEKSISEMRIADFANGNCTFRPYMHSFPFQLFALVKNTHSLPATVAGAVRQWFEYTARI